MKFASCHPDRQHRAKGLCFRCNTAIGQIEKENLVLKLINYLEVPE